MRIVGEAAFVLHARAWRETSLLLEVLSEHHGRIGLVARGVQSAKRQVLRAALQPLQHIRLHAVAKGELAQLTSAEALDAAPRLGGEAMLAAFYLHELMLRLLPRGDACPDLYQAYADTRQRLASETALGWTLRRFERDLLDVIGMGLAWDRDGDGEPIDPAARYQLDPEHGARRLLSDRGQGQRSQAATGAALLALADDCQPSAADIASLRLPLRGVLAHHLGPRGLKSWEMLGQLGRLKPPAAAPAD